MKPSLTTSTFQARTVLRTFFNEKRSGDPNPQYFSKSIAVQMGGVLPYKWEAYCNTNGRRIAGFPFLRSLEARKVRRYKWGAYCRTNWRCTAVLFRQVVGVGVSETLLIQNPSESLFVQARKKSTKINFLVCPSCAHPCPSVCQDPCHPKAGQSDFKNQQLEPDTGKIQTANSTHHPHKIDNQRRECKIGGGAYFSFFEAAPRPSLFRGVRQFVGITWKVSVAIFVARASGQA